MAQATITITIADSSVTLVDMRDTLCLKWGYNGDGSNASKVAFIKARLIEYIRNSYADQKINDAALSANVASVGADIT